MSRSVQSHKNKYVRTISQIGEKEFLIEGEAKWVRFGCQFDPAFVTSANIEGGPFLLVGDSFLGQGKIANIQNLETEKKNYILIKVSLY